LKRVYRIEELPEVRGQGSVIRRDEGRRTIEDRGERIYDGGRNKGINAPAK
jgi:hypothetical protein